MNILVSWGPMLLLIGVWIYFMRQMQGGGKGGAFSFGKSKARMLDEANNTTTFADVAGCEEAKEVDQLLDLFLGFIAAGDIGEGRGVVGLVEHAGLRLSEAEGAALAAALHLPHEVDPHADQQQHRAPGHKNTHQRSEERRVGKECA